MIRTATATTRCAVALAAALAVGVAGTPSASAEVARPTTASTTRARFEGRPIDLQRGWGDASTCVVWRRDDETDCYRSEQAADLAVQRHVISATHEAFADVGPLTDLVAGGVAASTATSCGDWLVLYEHIGHQGRSLRFRERGIVQDLADWGFAGQTSSYRVGDCGADLRSADGTPYPGDTRPYARAARMGAGWNDQVRYLRIR